MFRIFIIIIIVSIAVSASAVSPRLAALAEDGLLVDDVWADHLWPGSLAGRDNRASFQIRHAWQDELSGGYSGDVTVGHESDDFGPTWRLFLVDSPTSFAQDVMMGVQTGYSTGNLSLGLGLVYDCGASERRREGYRLLSGIRWSPQRRVVVDFAHEWSQPSKSWNDEDEIISSALRGRIYVDLGGGMMLVAAAERDLLVRDQVALWWVHPDDRARRVESGFLFWPDADSQLLFVWIHEELEYSYSDGEDKTVRTGDHEGAGFRCSFESRLSYWWTWRLGFESLVLNYELTPQEWSPAPSRLRSNRFGVGAAIHLGDWDLNTAYSSRVIHVDWGPAYNISHFDISFTRTF